MSYPAQRVTINAADYRLLRPGLELLANGLANAKLGLFPRRNAWHGIDEQASAIYLDREFDQAMADRIVTVRGKLWHMTSSRRVRLDVFDIAVLALALRLRNKNVGPTDSPADTTELAYLGRRLEACRKCAKRATITRIGTEEYHVAATCWGRFAAWCRFNLLNFTASAINLRWRKNLWRSQREQLAVVIDKLLADGFYESPDAEQKRRLITLMTSSSRRGRLHVGLRELIANPAQFSDVILRFISKRISLKLLPNAPRPAWQVITDRTDKFEAYRKSRTQAVKVTGQDAPLPGAGGSTELPLPGTVPVPDVIVIPAGLIVSDHALQDHLAAWVKNEIPRSYWTPVRDQGRHIVKHGLTDHYQRPFTAKTIEGLIEELRPRVKPMLAEEPVNEFVDWLLGIILAVRSKPFAIYDAVSYAVGHAVRLESKE